jgi:hypothetical protein
MSDERLLHSNPYVPPGADHTQRIVERQSGEQLGTRYWAPFDMDHPETLVDPYYWFFLLSPQTGQRVQAAILGDSNHQLRLVWAENIAPRTLLTRDERIRVLVSITSAVVDQDDGSGQPVATRWIRAYANGEREDQGSSLAAGALTRMLVQSNIDQGIIYTAATVYTVDEGTSIHILTDEVL